MPFVSEQQRRLFYAKKERGEMDQDTIDRWNEETPKDKKLPKYVHHKKKKEHEMEKAAGFVANFEKIAKVLTTTGRKHIKEDNFALPGRRYPIHDESHARNALSRVAQYGTPEEQQKVRAAVARKYPGLGHTSDKAA